MGLNKSRQTQAGGATSEDKKTLVIRTDINGHNAGRTYIHRTKNHQDLKMWYTEISAAMKKAKSEHDFQQEIEGKSRVRERVTCV